MSTVEPLSHAHTTNACITNDGLVEKEKKEMTNQYVDEKRLVFSSDLREWRGMSDRVYTIPCKKNIKKTPVFSSDYGYKKAV